MGRIFIYLLLVFLLPGMTVFAGSSDDDYFDEPIEKRRFDSDKLEKLTKNRDYTDKLKEEEPPAMRNFNTNFALPSWLSWVGYGLGIALIVFLLVMLFKNQVFGNKRIKGDRSLIDLEDLDEEGFKEAEFDRLLREALVNGDYRLAIRLYYLSIIQNLVLNEWIEWKKDKTNYEYLRELRNRDIFYDMQAVTVDFERVWYGDLDLDQKLYDRLSPRFSDLVKRTGGRDEK
jgi:hypothetical protein